MSRVGPATDSPRSRHCSGVIIGVRAWSCEIETADRDVRRADRIDRENDLAKYIIVLFLAVIVAGGVFLAIWDIPAPSESVEKTIPNDRFPR